MTPLRDSARQAVAKWRAESEHRWDRANAASESGRDDVYDRHAARAIALSECADELEALVRALPDGEAVAWRIQWRGLPAQFTEQQLTPDEVAKLRTRDCTCEPLYATPAQATRVGEWLPIESAPRDGARVLIRADNTYVAGWTGLDADRDAWIIVNDCWIPEYEIKGWQPLPAPPAATQHPAAVVGNGETK